MQTFALTANFCVCLYFFLGGYGLYKRWSKGKFQVADAVTALYKAYWKVFALFIPIAFLCFSRTGDGINALCTRYVFTDVKSLITTILCDASGWSCSLNSEWWFFGSYVCVLPMGYLFCCAIRRHQNFWVDLFLVFGFDLCISGIFPCIARTEIFAPLSYHVFYSRFLLISGMASTFFAGIVLAKYDAVCRMKARLLTLPFPVACSCLGVAVLYWFRAFVASGSMDILYCALMVPMLSIVLDRLRPAKRFLGLLGKHSTNMWLTHSFFAYYFLETTFLVYATRNVWVDLAILTALSFAASVFVNWFWNAGTKSFRIAGKTS